KMGLSPGLRPGYNRLRHGHLPEHGPQPYQGAGESGGDNETQGDAAFRGCLSGLEVDHGTPRAQSGTLWGLFLRPTLVHQSRRCQITERNVLLLQPRPHLPATKQAVRAAPPPAGWHTAGRRSAGPWTGRCPPRPGRTPAVAPRSAATATAP